jgi:hypothetical protein
MAVKRVARKGCYVRPAAASFMTRQRNIKFNCSVPMAIEAVTGRPFAYTWMQMKCGPLRWSGFWKRKAKRSDHAVL